MSQNNIFILYLSNIDLFNLCNSISNETKAGILTSGQIKREKMTEELHTEPEEETPQINMTALLTDTQVMQHF